MNLRCIAQAAAILGRFGKKWEHPHGPPDELAITEYMKQSRILCRSWNRRIQENRAMPESLYQLSQLADEILVSELLTRVMGAELLVLSERIRQEEPSKIAFRSMSDHYQCREKLFDLIEQKREATSTYLRCQRLARKIERWSDLLISPLTDSESAVHASYETERCLDFGEQWYHEQITKRHRGTFQVQLAALSVTVPKQEIEDSVCREAHRSRNRSVLSFVSAKSSMHTHGFEMSELVKQISTGIGVMSTTFASPN